MHLARRVAPGIDGLETLKQLRALGSEAAVVIISGHGNIETAVRATKLGAFDFIEKPLSIEKTVLTVRNALRQQRLELINADMAAALAREYTMVGESVAMRALRKQISIVAPTDGRILIYGESWTGKNGCACNSLRVASGSSAFYRSQLGCDS
jgi:two-component system nitrogen regulation response regulator NtrX